MMNTLREHPLMTQIKSENPGWERFSDLLRALTFEPTARAAVDTMVPALVNEIHEGAWPFVSDYRSDCLLASEQRTASHQKMTWKELLRLRWIMQQRQRAAKTLDAKKGRQE